MANYIQREDYLNKLIARRDNDEVKIITGPRRCGKSWLLKKIYKDYLLQHGVVEDEIINVSFDMEDETSDVDLSNRETLTYTTGLPTRTNVTMFSSTRCKKWMVLRR